MLAIPSTNSCALMTPEVALSITPTLPPIVSPNETFPTAEKTYHLMERFVKLLQRNLKENAPSLSPLHEVLQICFKKEEETIKEALTKREGYLRRLFSRENWEEWLEQRTELGQVFDGLIAYTENPHPSQLKKLDKDTILKANAKAEKLLRTLNKPPQESANNPSYLPSSISGKVVSLTLQNMIAYLYGMSSQQMVMMNLIQMPSEASSIPQLITSTALDLSKRAFSSSIGDLLFPKKSLEQILDSSGTVLIRKTGEEARTIGEALIARAEEGGNRLIVNLGEQGNLMIEKIGEELRLTVDETLRKTFEGAEVLLNLADLKLRTTVPDAARLAVQEAIVAVLDGTIGLSERERIEAEIKKYYLKTHDLIGMEGIFVDLIDYIHPQTQPSLSPEDKAELYKSLIKLGNIPGNAFLQARIFLYIGAAAINDQHLRTCTPSFFWSCPNVIDNIIDTIPLENIREILKTDDKNLFLQYFSELKQLPAPPKLQPLLESTPIGTVIAFASPHVPEGYLECLILTHKSKI